MCLIAFDWQPQAKRKLLLISNRDEFYHRPSKSAHYWQDAPEIYGGKDLEMGGTWLAVSASSRFAAVTNFRQPDINKYPRSRGHIPSEFLKSESSAIDWADNNKEHLNEFSGFNALLYDGEALVYLSNRNGGSAVTLDAGLYGLSNHLLDTPWPKVVKAKRALRHVSENAPVDQIHHHLLNSFQDDQLAEDRELPDTGVGIDLERMLSAMYIHSPSYGTRTTTAVSIHREGEIQFTERNYDPKQQGEFTQHHEVIIAR